MASRKSFFHRTYEIVKKVPKGNVVTYGQVAAMLGDAGAARTVGWALHAIHDPYSGVPWHRVVNAKGRISSCTVHSEMLQRKLLEAEGIRFDKEGKIDLKKYRWRVKRSN